MPALWTRIMAEIATKPMKIPLFPLDVVLFPGAPLPLHIFEERYKEMVAECIALTCDFGVVRAQRGGLAVIGCTARIVKVLERYDDGRLDILCQGNQRFEIEMLDNTRSFLQAEVDAFDDRGTPASRRDREELAALHFETLELIGAGMGSTSIDLDQPIAFQLASSIPSDLGFKQQLLGTRSDAERTRQLLDFYNVVLPKLRRGAHATRIADGNGHVM
jgi:Lon protease-like protein